MVGYLFPGLLSEALGTVENALNQKDLSMESP